MANPLPITCPAGEWKLVAENVVSGQLHLLGTKPKTYNILQTYVMTGGAVPTAITEGVIAFPGDVRVEEIGHSVAIDVYLWSVGEDTLIRADL